MVGKWTYLDFIPHDVEISEVMKNDEFSSNIVNITIVEMLKYNQDKILHAIVL